MFGWHITLSKHLTQGFVKLLNKLIPAQNGEIYTHFTPGVLNVKFCSDANSLTSEHVVYDQNTLGFMKFINTQIVLKEREREILK